MTCDFKGCPQEVVGEVCTVYRYTGKTILKASFCHEHLLLFLKEPEIAMGYGVTNQDLLDLVRQTITSMGGNPTVVLLDDVARLRSTILRERGTEHVITICRANFPTAFSDPQVVHAPAGGDGVAGRGV